jgi:uncharacterized protein DUF4936
MALSYFVYYRVHDDAPDARSRVMDALFHVAAATGVRGRLLVKREEPALWMEVYEPVSDVDRFEAALADAVAACLLDRLLLPGGVRHVECFTE